MIIFRRINENVPSNWLPGLHWYVEFHDDDYDMPFPLGIGFVTAYGCEPDHGSDISPYLDFVLVADQHRRNGVATAIVEACRQRWPNIKLMDEISELGSHLLESLDTQQPEGQDQMP